MWGQWCGSISGTNTGSVIINIDKDSPNKGRVLVSDNDPNVASFHADITISVSNDSFTADINNFVLYSSMSDLNERSQLLSSLPSYARLSGVIENNHIKGEWSSDIDTRGTIEAFYLENYITKEKDRVMSWHEFQSWVLTEKKSKSGLIFRGQPDSLYSLKTSFHRQNRRDFTRYAFEDIPELARHITANLSRNFNLDDPTEYSELLYLAQHHGFPTPLLDWTESPFVAAYFAFHQLDKEVKDGYVRIFSFDKELWIKNGHAPIKNIGEPKPSFSPHVISSRNNPRALPQQSLVTFSNVYNIEGLIKYFEDIDKVKYLTAIDIRKSDRNHVMKDLEIMGITASSLFPGLDGVCQALKEKRF